MSALIHSRGWRRRVLLIIGLSIAGWIIVYVVFILAHAASDIADAWPRTDFSKRNIELSEVQSGGPPRDGIPSIDKPVLTVQAEADTWLDPREPVIAVTIEGQVRAYPLQILLWHEIVNDEIAGFPISATYCPLCDTAVVFDRQVNDKVLEFGVSGKLRNSDMVMYDRQTESWWQQFTGKAIAGYYTGMTLKRVPSSVISYGVYKSAYPDGLVLSRGTGYERRYGINPYVEYDDTGNRPFAFEEAPDPRLPPMERILGLRSGEYYRAYPFTTLRNQNVINDRVGDLPVIVFVTQDTLSVLDTERISDSKTVVSASAYKRIIEDQELKFAAKDGRVFDINTGSEWNSLGTAVNGPLKGKQLEHAETQTSFAFVWLAFHPDSSIYSK